MTEVEFQRFSLGNRNAEQKAASKTNPAALNAGKR